MEIYYNEAADSILSCAKRRLVRQPRLDEGEYVGTYLLYDGRYAERHIPKTTEPTSTQKIYVFTPSEYMNYFPK